MPVSMFSSGNSALRGHSALIARWNSTRERILDDERRMSESQITEMDGTGLHDRENWPLGPGGVERSVSPEAVEDLEDGEDVGHAKKRVRVKEDAVSEDAVLRRSEDIGAGGVDDVYVSDIDDEDDGPGNGLDGKLPEHEQQKHDSARHVEAQAHTGASQEDEDGVSPDLADQLDQRRSSRRLGDPPAVPERSLARQSLQVPSSPELEVSPVRSEELSRYVSSEEELDNAPDREEEEVEDEEGEDRTSTARNSRQLLQDSDAWAPNSEPADEDVEESRDVVTPIPFGRDSMSDDSYHQRTPSTPQTNGNMYGHGRPSSILKGTPPSRSASRLSTHSVQLPHNRDRVRYSWQSIQDDEPNRPRIHIIKLVSNTATASAGFPQGEAFGFSISPGGRRIAAYNSARLYVLQTAALPVGISQDYALKRRPLAVEIIDEGNILAILADEHTINIYDLAQHRLQLIKTIKTDFPTTSIAVAPTGGLLAAAYEGGVEVFSLDPSALPTDRRAVRSQRMDRMAFSEDGSTLLGTTTRINVSSTVAVSVPVFPAAPSGVPTHEELKEAWCSELLHPENIRNSSHATFMRENRSTCNDRVFAWNGLADTFGVLNVSDMQYGSIDFPVVIQPPLSTCGGLGAAIHSCPAIDEHGDTVAMIVNDRTIRLYIVPHKADDDESTVEAHSIDHELDEGYGCPFSEVKWVYSSASLPAPLNNQTQVKGRLIVTSPGGVAEQGLSDETVDDIEGGRIILFDFDPQFAGQPGQTFSLTLGRSPPQLLEEQKVDVADEVALVRRRTVNQSKSGGLSQRPVTLGRAATTFGGAGRGSMRSPSPSSGMASGAGNSNRRSMLSIHSMQSEATQSLPDLVETSESTEEVPAIDEPYAQNAPRSHASLQRAASNAQRHRFQTLEERNQERVSVDSTGNFLPLPEYTEEPNAPLPSRFRAMAGLDAPHQAPPRPAVVTNVNGDRANPATSGPATAPAATADTFSAEQAYATAQASFNAAVQQRSDTSTQSPIDAFHPIQRSDTFNSTGPMPRSLQRAYNNAMAPLGSGPPPTLIGDWENVSPVVPSRQGTLMNGNLPHPPSSASAVPGQEPWDLISPVQPSAGQLASSPFGRAAQAAGVNPYRYSTSLLNPPGHTMPQRAPSNASYGTGGSTPPSRSGPVPTNRRLPPHMQAFRNAAATNASLFPPTHPSDHVPLRQPPSKAGSVAHPITAWHPPAPSTANSAPPGSARGHSRKSSLASKGAFASTAKAKNLGFFRKNKKKPFMPGAYPGQEYQDGSESTMMETRSMMTWMTKGENKCSVM